MRFRLPRFKRVSSVASLDLTERDLEIVRLVHRHRFLRSSHIILLIGTSSQQVLRRLKLLYHHGYLERPRSQIDYYHGGGSRPIVYGLGNKGGSLLKRELSSVSRNVSWGEKNRFIGWIFLEHALLVSDVMVSIELACRKSEVKFIPSHEFLTTGRYFPSRWKVRLNNQTKLGVIPDRVFALEFRDGHQTVQRVYYFLEADRGTMPIIRHNLSQTSIYRKFLAYAATWSQSIHRTRFGFDRFRVLTITPGPKRVESLISACSGLKSGQGLFLFADRSILNNPEHILKGWKTCRGKMEALSR